jgi:hypothetical protein
MSDSLRTDAGPCSGPECDHVSHRPGLAPPPQTALQMALNCVSAVERAAEFQERDPLGAYVAKVGNQGAQAAELAGQLALVSIAEDLHWVVERFKRDDTE